MTFEMTILEDGYVSDSVYSYAVSTFKSGPRSDDVGNHLFSYMTNMRILNDDLDYFFY